MGDVGRSDVGKNGGDDFEVAEPLNPVTTKESVAVTNTTAKNDTGERKVKIQKFVDDFFAQLDANEECVVRPQRSVNRLPQPVRPLRQRQ